MTIVMPILLSTELSKVEILVSFFGRGHTSEVVRSSDPPIQSKYDYENPNSASQSRQESH